MLFGCGSSFAFQPSLVILGHYFRRRLGLANGVVTAASSLFTVALSVLLKKVVGPLGLSRTFQILSLFMLVQSLLALSFRPLIPSTGAGMGSQGLTEEQGSTAGTRWSRGVTKVKRYFNARVFRVATYRVWAFGVATAVLGYMVPYIHLVRGLFLDRSLLIHVAVRMTLCRCVWNACVGVSFCASDVYSGCEFSFGLIRGPINASCSLESTQNIP